jgi:hypothetical protein
MREEEKGIKKQHAMVQYIDAVRARREIGSFRAKSVDMAGSVSGVIYDTLAKKSSGQSRRVLEKNHHLYCML